VVFLRLFSTLCKSSGVAATHVIARDSASSASLPFRCISRSFAPANTIAFATTVANLSHLLVREPMPLNATWNCTRFGTMSDRICNYSLPNGTYLAGEDRFANITALPLNGTLYDIGQLPKIGSIAYQNIPVVFDFFMIYYSASVDNVLAIEASLSFCGQTYNTSVNNGLVTTNAFDGWGKLDMSNISDWYPMWPIVGNSPIHGNVSTLWVEEGYVSSLQATLASIFTGYLQVIDDTVHTFSTVAVQGFKNYLVGVEDDLAALQLYMDKIAISISNKYKTQVKVSEASNTNFFFSFRTVTGSEVVSGINYQVETYVLVE
jgi:hypothetical protein